MCLFFFTLSTKYSTYIIEYYWLLSHVGFKSFLIRLGRWKHVNVKWLVTLNGCWWLLEENLSSWVFMQTLMDGSANISVFSIITVETLWWQKLTNPPSTCCIERHCLWHIVSRSLCIVLGVRKEIRSWMILSEENPAWFQCLMTGAVCFWGPPEESGWKNVTTAVTSGTDRQTGWLPMSRSYLAGNLERGQRLYASMWHCVKAGCRNANKATLHLLGTFTQIRCD